MATIIPRWEWRTFGSSFGDAEDRFGALTPHGVQDRLLAVHVEVRILLARKTRLR